MSILIQISNTTVIIESPYLPLRCIPDSGIKPYDDCNEHLSIYVNSIVYLVEDLIDILYYYVKIQWWTLQ